jgi:hypothetical protein
MKVISILKKFANPRLAPFAGPAIDRRDEDESVSDSMQVNRELDSNEIDERE